MILRQMKARYLKAVHVVGFFVGLSVAPSASATTKGLSQIVTPDLQGPGELSLSFQAQSEQIANPFELQAEMGLTKWAEFAVFRGFKPDDWIFGTEFGLLTKEPWLLSTGFVNWSPHLNVDPQPFIEAGYTPSITNSSLALLMLIIATKPSSATPTISMKPGGSRSIGKVVPATHPPSVLLGTSPAIFRSILPST